MQKTQSDLFKYITTELPFIRPIYRTLLSQKKAYAAFEKEQLVSIINKISPTSTVLDPMSGYGGLAKVCREMDIPTCSIETNLPSYLWQIFNEPNNRDMLLYAVKILEKATKQITTEFDFEATEEWFPEESKRLLLLLWNVAINQFKAEENACYEKFLAAVLLPVLGRFSAYSNGILSIHVKQGGIVFYKDLVQDLRKYLSFIATEIISHYRPTATTNRIIFHDALQPYKQTETFSYVVTSPPYPNMIDYYTIFYPENYAVEKIIQLAEFPLKNPRSVIIGSPKISDFKKNNIIDMNLIRSQVAKDFLSELSAWKGTKRAVNDNRLYYVPYYYIYFLKLEKAYANISMLLDKQFTGYITVVNNTSRKFIVPVAEFILETWQHLGCHVSIDKELSNERSHVGSINPRAIGFKARHMEYVLRLTKGH